MLKKFPNYCSSYRTTLDTHSLVPVIVYSGLVTYTHKSFIDYCKYIKRQFNVDSIDVVISTWDYDQNNSALFKLLNKLEEYSDLKVSVVLSSYNEEEFFEVITCADEVHYGSEVLLKRLIPFYIFLKALLYIKQNIPNAYIFKVRSRLKFHYLHRIDLIDDVHKSLRHVVELYRPELLDRVPPERILFSRFFSSDGVDEIVMNSSLDLFLDILGHSLEEFTYKISTIFNSYRIKYPNMSIPGLMANQVFPHSGSLFLGELAKTYTSNLVCFSPLFYYNSIEPLTIIDKEGNEIRNPDLQFYNLRKFKFITNPNAPILENHKDIIA